MKALKIFGKVMVIPLIVLIAILWLIIKIITVIYSVLHGFLVLGLVLLILLAWYEQMWPQLGGLVILCVASFLVLFAGGAIIGLIEFVESLLVGFLKS